MTAARPKSKELVLAGWLAGWMAGCCCCCFVLHLHVSFPRLATRATVTAMYIETHRIRNSVTVGCLGTRWRCWLLLEVFSFCIYCKVFCHYCHRTACVFRKKGDLECSTKSPGLYKNVTTTTTTTAAAAIHCIIIVAELEKAAAAAAAAAAATAQFRRRATVVSCCKNRHQQQATSKQSCRIPCSIHYTFFFYRWKTKQRTH
jgi:hypothetical protein